MPGLWFLQALGAAVMWGLGYVLSERLFKAGISPAFFLIFLNLASVPAYVLFLGGAQGAARSAGLLTGDAGLAAIALVAVGTFVAGNLLIFSAVMGKNAAVANMVEVSFPLFTVLFAWALFREVQVTWTHALGGLFVLSGVGIIYWKG
ncbi:MAG TPA: hypothetical protein DDX54_00940 [Rhodospirillaceae bacterium]|jgi:drug/metabolite transporter (DMT)-like permease|nr:EamA family transporter [Alphaproteobacteria bacterium]HBH25960.1 hypothetical protein [Rhodospirillaceae bacterium]